MSTAERIKQKYSYVVCHHNRIKTFDDFESECKDTAMYTEYDFGKVTYIFFDGSKVICDNDKVYFD